MKQRRASQREPKRTFEKPVSGLFDRDLIIGLRKIITSGLYLNKLDIRDWMKPQVIDFSNEASESELWFDYVSDTGDGQKAAYNIAYLCMSELWAEPNPGPRSAVKFDNTPAHSLRLPRGQFLFVGGDTSYHIADYRTIARRFKEPFDLAFEELSSEGKVKGDTRPLIGVPGNHDYYDLLDGFNRQFRKPAGSINSTSPGRLGPLLKISGFHRLQEASYVAAKLPFGWWIFGLDSQHGEIDFRQSQFFREIIGNDKPDKLIVTTPEPTTVLGKQNRLDSAISKTLQKIGLETPYLQDGKLDKVRCRLDLSGDTHHYARYWGPESPNQTARYASVVSGLGGATLHPSHTDFGEVKSRELFPSPDISRRAMSKELFSPIKLLTAGYVWVIAFLISFVVSFSAQIPVSTSNAILSFAASVLKIPQHRLMHLPVYSAHDYLDRPIRSAGMLWGVLLVIGAIAAIGFAVIYSKAWLVKLKVPSRDEKAVAGHTIERQVTLALVLIASALQISWILFFAGRRPSITNFESSALVLSALIWVAFALSAVSAYGEYLFKLCYHREVKRSESWPVMTLLLVAGITAASAVWLFGKQPGFWLISDLVFIAVVLGVLIGLLALAIASGAEFHSTGGKIGFGLLGLWHAILQVAVPSVLVFFGTERMLIFAIALILILSLLGMWLSNREAKIALLAVWLTLGALLLALPLYGESLTYLNSQLDLAGTLIQSQGNGWALWRSIVAGAAGAVLGCVWLGWYLSVALAFKGHNDYAGGAVRVDRFQEFIRIRLTPDSLTAYVIAIDEPKSYARELKPKLIDIFTLSS